MKTSDIDRLAGVKGLEAVSLGDLLARAQSERANWQDLPASPGVYAVCMSGWQTCSLLPQAGLAKHAKPEDTGVLEAKRKQILAGPPTNVIYLGKAGCETSDLCQRLSQLAHFGVGKWKNHKGGRWLWQLDGIEKARIYMWCCPRGRPESLKRELLERFRDIYGDLPLANLV